MALLGKRTRKGSSDLRGSKVSLLCRICESTLAEHLFEMQNVWPSLALKANPVFSESKPAQYSKGDLPPVNTLVSPQVVPSEAGMDLKWGYCQTCQLVQQVGTPPLDLLKPKYLWQRFAEPESHLDSLAEELFQIVRKPAQPIQVLGLTWQDASLIQRIDQLQFQDSKQGRPEAKIDGLDSDSVKNLANEFEVFREAHSGPGEHPFGIETLQFIYSKKDFFDPMIKKWNDSSWDLVIARDILEHVFDLNGFMENLNRLLSSTSLLLIEVPDGQKMLEKNQHELLWEHHISYFSRSSLWFLFEKFGMEVLWIREKPLEAGDYLLALVRSKKVGRVGGDGDAQDVEYSHLSKPQSFLKNGSFLEEQSSLRASSQLWENFLTSSEERRKTIKDQIERLKTDGNRIVVYGSHHVAYFGCLVYKWLDQVDLLVDDNAYKQGFFWPGTQLAINSSEVLCDQVPTICIHFFGDVLAQKIEARLKKTGRFFGRFLHLQKLISET